MPVVGRYGLPQVAPQATPNVQRDTSAPSDAFQPARPVDLSGPLSLAQQIAHEETQKANDVAVLDADNQLSDLRNAIMYAPATGVLQAKGKNALDAASVWQEQWTKGIGQIRQGLKNDAQRASFDRLAQGQYARANEEIENHVAAERQQYEQGTVAANLDRSYNDAVTNADKPDVVAAAIEKGKAVALDWARRQGLSPEETQDAVGKMVSRVHAGVMQQLVDTGNDLAATAYFAQHQSELVASDLIPTERLVQHGSLLGETQRQTDQIMASAPTFDHAMASARAITDPQLRDKVEDGIRQRFADQQTAQKLDEEHRFDRLSQTLRQNGGQFNALPASDRLALSPQHFEQLQNLADDIRHPKVVTNDALYAHLINLAGLNDSTRAAFVAMDLTQPKFRQQLSESDYQYILGLQRQMRDGRQGGSSRTTQNGLRRREEAKVLHDASQAQSMQQARAFLPDSTQRTLNQFSPIPRVTVPQWMVDSAKVDPDYAEYLQLYGVHVTPEQTPDTTQAPSKRPAPGGPLSSTGLNLTPKP